MRRKKAQITSLNNYHDAELSGGDGSSSSSISSGCELRVEKDIRVPNFARDRNHDNARMAAHSEARSTPVDSCDQDASTEVVRL